MMKIRREPSRVFVQFGNGPWGEIAPLPGWSRETLTEALRELEQCKWVTQIEDLEHLELLPSVHFGLESALLKPLQPAPVPESALLMGTPREILAQAAQRKKEGHTVAKLKVGRLSFDEAAQLIDTLAHHFLLRIDVNRAWDLADSLHFFAPYPKDLFDYIEEPCKNPKSLKYFTHPLAVDESFPHDLSLQELEEIPHLKALIYKPTMQGGLSKARPLQAWANQRKLQLVLSSSFESDIGLAHIASMARRLNPNPPHIGLGTRWFNVETKRKKACAVLP